MTVRTTTFSGSEEDLSHDSQPQQAAKDYAQTYTYHQVPMVTEEAEAETENADPDLMTEEQETDNVVNGDNECSSSSSLSAPSSSSSSSLAFRVFLLCVLAIQTSTHALLLRYSRGLLHEPYSVVSTIIMGELLKLLLSVLMIVHLSGWSVSIAGTRLWQDIRVSLPLCLPALLYLIQNQLAYVGLQLLDPGTFSVLTQLKLLTTAVFAVVLLRRHISLNQWRALLLLFVGVVMLQNRPANSANTNTTGSSLSWLDSRLGELSVLGMALLSGVAGVYFELVLKGDSSMDMWDRNMQMSMYSIVFGFLSIALLPRSQLQLFADHSFFYGYSRITVLIVALIGVGGLLVAAAVAYTDNIMKNFASSVSVVLTSLISAFYFHDLQCDLPFVCGATAVIVAIFNYSYDPVPKQEQDKYSTLDMTRTTQNNRGYPHSYSSVSQLDTPKNEYVPEEQHTVNGGKDNISSYYGYGCLHIPPAILVLLLSLVILPGIAYVAINRFAHQLHQPRESVVVGIVTVPWTVPVNSTRSRSVDIISAWIRTGEQSTTLINNGTDVYSWHIVTSVDGQGAGLAWAELQSFSAMYSLYPSAPWYYKASDDAFVNLARLAQVAASPALNSGGLFYIGSPVSSALVSYNWCVGGAGYLISNGLMLLIQQRLMQDSWVERSGCCADQHVGELAASFNVSCIPHPALFDHAMHDYLTLLSTYHHHSGILSSPPHNQWPDLIKFPSLPGFRRGSLAPNFNWNGRCGSDNFTCIIAYGLYGNRTEYTRGAVINAHQVNVVYPGWISRFYLDHTVPNDTIAELYAAGAEVVFMDNSTAHSGSDAGKFWRFLVVVDSTVDRYILRDTDSRLNLREAAAVQEWIESGYSIHLMRDHPLHKGTVIMAGMWGGVKGAINNNIIADIAYAKRDGYEADQHWLERAVWPVVKLDQITHDSYNCDNNSNSWPFPTQRPSPEIDFVGSQFDEQGQLLRTKWIVEQDVPVRCRKHTSWTKG